MLRLFPVISGYFFVILFVNPSFGQSFKGKVSHYTDTYYATRVSYGMVRKGDRLNDSIFHDKYVSFDSKGNIEKMIEYNTDGTIHCTYLGKTNCPGNQLECVCANLEPRITIDRKPFLVEAVKYPSGDMCEIEYRYDNQGWPIDETIRDLMGGILFTVAIKREKSGYPLEYIFSNGAVDQFKYDFAGNRIEWRARTHTGRTIVTNYKYDKYGNLVEEVINDFFKSTYKYHYEYNTFQYEYDRQGNWIRRVEYEHELPVRMVVRTFKYSDETR